jgi:Protein of unknown function (DUF2878)
MTQVANFVGYQLVWFAAVCGASRGWSWPAVLAMAVFAGWQLSVSGQRTVDVRLAGAAVVAGVALDGILSASGIVHYAASAAALPPGGAPLWILALWLSFALTLNHSLRWLIGQPVLGLALGAAGGPLAYAAAARLGAVTFASPAWHGLASLAAGWAIAVALLCTLARVWRDRTWVAGTVSS